MEDARERVLVGVALPLALVIDELAVDVLMDRFGGTVASRLTRDRWIEVPDSLPAFCASPCWPVNDRMLLSLAIAVALKDPAVSSLSAWL